MPVDFRLTEEDRLIAESARGILRQADADGIGPSNLWQVFQENGWFELALPEGNGGLGAGPLALATLLIQIGRARAATPYVPVAIHAAGMLARIGGSKCAQVLSRIIGGELVAAARSRTELTARREAGCWFLDGEVRLVPSGGAASLYLLAVRCPDGRTRLFEIERDTPGLRVQTVQRPAGPDDGDLMISGAAAQVVRVSASASDDNVVEAVQWAADRAAIFAGFEAVGAMEALLEATIEHTQVREQFGRALIKFQAVEHGVADMIVALEEARAMAVLALSALEAGGGQRQLAVSAAKITIGEAGRKIAHIAIQFHGAMGVTEELDVGLYAKRLLTFDHGWGSRDHHIRQLAEAVRSPDFRICYLADRGSGNNDHELINFDANERAFRTEVRTFLAAALPERLSRAQGLTATVYPEADIAAGWHSILAEKGWSAANWPAAFGGTGWNAIQRYIWAQECGRAQAPIISPLGLTLVGPVLMQFGTKNQQERFPPGIVSGENLWCQGFSEPGAGSDLASLSTRAMRDGEHYVVNGSKIWTTHAHFADYMAALVRTGEPDGRRSGITFLLIDMKAKGVNIRPIRTIGGDHEVNQVFFDDVHVPLDQRVGKEGQGWEIAKFMLEYERGGDVMSGGHRALLAEIHALAQTRVLDDAEGFWRQFAQASRMIDAFEMLELMVMTGASNSAAVPSILKLRASEIQQSVTELGVRLLGDDALRWRAERPLPANASPEEALVPRYLNSRANTIFGGAREIQKTLIARSVIG